MSGANQTFAPVASIVPVLERGGEDFAELYDNRTYEDDPRAAARPFRPVMLRPYLPQGGAVGEAMS